MHLELIQGCRRETCSNYEKIRNINILIGKSYARVFKIENFGLNNTWVFLDVQIAAVEPRLQIDTNIFSGRKFNSFDYQTFGSMNVLDLNDAYIWFNKIPYLS